MPGERRKEATLLKEDGAGHKLGLRAQGLTRIGLDMRAR